MKKYVFAVLLASLLLLFACVPTPDEPVVLQKDQDLMIEKGSETLPPEESYTPPEVPKRYRYDYEEGTLTVHIDAPVTVPDKPLPIARVRACGYDQGAVKRLFALLTDGDTLMTPTQQWTATKEDLEADIKRAMEMLEDGSYKDADITEEEWKEHIEELKQDYKNAPFSSEVRESTVADGSYYKERYDGGIVVDCADAFSKDRNLTIRSAFNEDTESVFKYDRSDAPMYSRRNARFVDADSELPEILGLTYRDALDQVNALLGAIGEPFRIKTVFLVDDEQNALAEGGGTDGIVQPANHCALMVQCQRMYAGVPIATDVDGVFGNSDRYAIDWAEESLWITVDREGIVSIDWWEPLTVTEPVADSTNLMPFDRVREIAEKMIRVIYLPFTDRINPDIERIDICVDVSSVNLELIRVREQNNVTGKTGLLIPVWVFYGTIRKSTAWKDGTLDGGYSHYGLGGLSHVNEGDVITLCINAIDGTIIDPLRGY